MGQMIVGGGFDYASVKSPAGSDAQRNEAQRMARESTLAELPENDQHLRPVPNPAERRHSFRVNVPARASLWLRGQLAGYYTVVDLSLGGCSLEGGPSRIKDELVDVVLHVAHRPPIVLTGRVKRNYGDQVALCFERLSPMTEEVLQDIVVETYATIKTRDSDVALVIEPRHAVRHTLVRNLRELGKRAVGVSTALDAVQLLVEEGEHVHTVFIEAESDVVPSLELVEFLTHNHPRVKRVLIGEPRELALHWLAEASGEVHAMIDSSCDREALHRALRKLDRTPADGAAL